MAAKIGLWIDHRQAVIVTIMDAGADTRVIKSNAEKHLRAGDHTLKGPFKARLVPADDRQEREFNEHLKIYYNKIIESIRHAESLFIFGPGESKNELEKQLEKNNLGGLIVDMETADKMTKNQILAKVCQYYSVNIPADLDIIESPHQKMKTSGSSSPRQA
jgi:hypothetical protein